MSKLEERKAEVAMLEAGEEFAAAKAAVDGSPQAEKTYRAAKAKLTAARAAFRAARQVNVADGAAAAQPKAIAGKVKK